MDDKLQQIFVDRVREAAKEQNMPISHLPDVAEVGRAHFYLVMKGTRSPTLRWMGKIANALDTPLHELLEPDTKKSRKG